MNHGGAPPTPHEAYIETQEYIAAMEERATLQDDHIEDLMGCGPPTTISATDSASEARVITRVSNRRISTTGQKLNKLQSSLATLLMTVSS